MLPISHIDDERLILLFGLPRSGTTWVGKVFDSHPDVLYRHEPEAVTQLKGVPLFIEDAEVERFEHTIRNYADHLLGMSHPRVVGKRPLLPKRYLTPFQFRLHALSVLTASMAARVAIQLPVYNPAKALPRGKVHVVWKSISGFGRLPAILRGLPHARAIIIQRHPCGFVASQIRGLKAGRFGDVSAFDAQRSGRVSKRIREQISARYGLSDADIDRLTVEERFAWRWVINHEQVLERTAGLLNCMSVWYEDLCCHPQETYQKLFEFAGLDWPDITTQFLGSTVTKENSDYYSVFKNPLDSATRWQRELSQEAIERVLAVASQSWVAETLFR